MRTRFIKLHKAKGGDVLLINPIHIIVMQPTPDYWRKQTDITTYMSLASPFGQCEVKESVEEIVELIKKVENEAQV